ncbi:hypothetical protein M885DRAFT_573721 [Pelagophyceae sp. CCMP2097]|nr:hypothetical protein M885DRAFT_573721 [Pelagophyceae sp. CCMP2097]
MRYATAWLRGVRLAVLWCVSPHKGARCARARATRGRFTRARAALYVAEVASWARATGRTLVEPAACDSLVLPPWDSYREAKRLGISKSLGLAWPWASASTTCHAGKTIGFSRYWQVPQMLCLDEFTKNVLPGLRAKDVALHTPKVWDRLGGDIGYANDFLGDVPHRVIVVGGFTRSINTADISRGACTRTSCFGGFKYAKNDDLIQLARETQKRAGAVAIAQWRSETALPREPALAQDCAEKLAKRIIAAVEKRAAQQGGNLLPIALVSDLREGASWTYTNQSTMSRIVALRTLDEAFEKHNLRVKRSRDRLGVVSAALAKVQDRGERAILEQSLAAAAPVLVIIP